MSDTAYWTLFGKLKWKYPEWSEAQVGIVVHKYPYCHCGAKMKEGEEK